MTDDLVTVALGNVESLPSFMNSEVSVLYFVLVVVMLSAGSTMTRAVPGALSMDRTVYYRAYIPTMTGVTVCVHAEVVITIGLNQQLTGQVHELGH